MSCNDNQVSALSVDQVQALTVSTQSFGFSQEDVDAVRAQHGDEILSLMTEAARSGFSVGFIMDILKRFGPNVLQFLYDVWNQQVMAAGFAAQAQGESVILEGPLTQGIQDGIVNMLVQKLMEQLPNILPALIEKYGDQILKLVIDLILKTITPSTQSNVHTAVVMPATNPLA